MVWQSYAYFYNNQDDISKMMEHMNKYQNIVHKNTESDEPVGGELTKICFCKLLEPINNKKYVLVFGLEGGYINCYNFFSRREVKLEELNTNILKLTEPQENWLCVFKDFNNFDDQFINQLANNNFF